MLYNITISANNEMGNTNGNRTWEYKVDQKYTNYRYIENDAIKQRIRIFTNPNSIKFENATTQNNVNIETFALGNTGEVFLSSNYNNMAVSVVGTEPDAPNGFTDIAYITVDVRKYKLVRYTMLDRDSEDIIQTYRKKDGYQGCALAFMHSARIEDNGLMIIELKNTETNRYERFRIKYNSEDGISVESEQVSQKLVNTLKDLEEKFDKGFLSFKVTLNHMPFPTLVYITNDEHVDDAMAILEQNAPANFKCISLDNDESLDYLNKINLDTDVLTDPNDAAVHSTLIENIVNDRIRAVTLVDIDVPYKFCKQYNILYLFKHSTKDNHTFCLRSS